VFKSLRPVNVNVCCRFSKRALCTCTVPPAKKFSPSSPLHRPQPPLTPSSTHPPPSPDGPPPPIFIAPWYPPPSPSPPPPPPCCCCVPPPPPQSSSPSTPRRRLVFSDGVTPVAPTQCAHAVPRLRRRDVVDTLLQLATVAHQLAVRISESRITV